MQVVLRRSLERLVAVIPLCIKYSRIFLVLNQS